MVTGASSGIGAEIAKVLAEHGVNLVLVARREDRLQALATDLRERLDVEAHVHACDLARPGAVADLVAHTEAAGLPIDILVNNAGVGSYERFLDTSWDGLQTQIQVNAVALTELTHRYVPPMIERGRGQVMNIASVGAYAPTPNFAVYAATKAYVRHMTEALDDELAGTGVRALCVNPGGTRTEFMALANQVVRPQGERLMMSADRCARIAVDKMIAGRRNVVTGALNAIGMWALRWLPRAWYPAIARRVMSSAVDKGPASASPPGP